MSKVEIGSARFSQDATGCQMFPQGPWHGLRIDMVAWIPQNHCPWEVPSPDKGLSLERLDFRKGKAVIDYNVCLDQICILICHAFICGLFWISGCEERLRLSLIVKYMTSRHPTTPCMYSPSGSRLTQCWAAGYAPGTLPKQCFRTKAA